jgi:non-heme chloroperoxidase
MVLKNLTTSDDVVIVYTDEGVGRPVVLLHGMLCHKGHWAFQREMLLSTGFRVIAVDLRGHGESDNPEHGQRIARMGQDLAELLAAERIEDAAIVGHSMGASVALAYVSLHGSRALSHLVLIDQSPRIMNDATWQWGVRHVSWGKLEAQVAGQEPWSDFTREPPTPAHVRQMLDREGAVGDFFASPIGLRVDHFTADWRDVMPLVEVPTWVVTAEHSPSFPLEGMQWVANSIPGARLTVYPHSGHCPHWNEYKDFNRDLASFLETGGDRFNRP